MRTAPRRRANRPRPSVEALEGRALLAVAGSLDPTFGSGTGYVKFPLPTDYGGATTVSSEVTAPDGDIVVTGSYSGSTTGSILAVAEFNPNGTPVATFGDYDSTYTHGVADFPVDPSSTSPVDAVTAVQPNGQILVAFSGPPGFERSSPIEVIRLNTDGSLDPTFGSGGLVILSTLEPASDGPGPLQSVKSMLVQSNGQILLVGTAYSDANDGTRALGAMRLDGNGAVDTTYGTDGMTIVIPSTGEYEGASPVGAVLQSDGDLVIVGDVLTSIDVAIGEFGTAIYDVGAVRLTTSGTLDTTYGTNGVTLIPGDPSDPDALEQNEAYGVAIQSNDEVLISGYNAIIEVSTGTNSDPTLYRLTTSGTLDTTFGTGGAAMPPVDGPVVVQADGSIDVEGSTIVTNNLTGTGATVGPDYVVQYQANGTPATTFGDTTVQGVPADLVPTTLIAKGAGVGLAIEPTTGDVLVAGGGGDDLLPGVSVTGQTGGLYAGFTVAAFSPSATNTMAAPPVETPPASFDGSGLTDVSIYSPNNGTFYYQQAGTAGSAVVSDAYGSAGADGSIPAAADYAGIGSDQVAVYLPEYGIYTIQPTATTPGLAIQLGIAGAGQSIPAPADYYGTGQADVAVYMPAVGAFAIKDPTGKTPGLTVFLGIPGEGQSIPAPADYFGTGQADIAVYLTQSATFAIIDPVTNQVVLAPYGKPGVGQSIPVPGDYDGSGHDELAVYIPSIGAYIYNAANGNQVVIPIGAANSGDIPVPGDYDGSGRTEAAIYSPSGGYIEYMPTDGPGPVKIPFGNPNDGSLPAAAPSGALPVFGVYLAGSGSGSGIRADAATLPSTSTVTPASVTPTSTTASKVPAGPTVASMRVARSPINQAAPDPLDLA